MTGLFWFSMGVLFVLVVAIGLLIWFVCFDDGDDIEFGTRDSEETAREALAQLDNNLVARNTQFGTRRDGEG